MELVVQMLIFLPLILGGYITFSLLRVPDLSIESAFLMGAIGGALGSFPGAILCGMVVSLTTALLHIKARFPVLLAAIITIGFYHGMSLLIMKEAILPVTNRISFSITALVVLLLIALFSLLFRTELGRAFAIFGRNPLFFSRQKLSTTFVLVSGFLCAGALAGLSGFLVASTNGFVDISMGSGLILALLSNLMLGKIAIAGRFPSCLPSIIGCILYFLVQNAIVTMGFDLKYYSAFQAVLFATLLTIKNGEKQSKRGQLLDQLGV